MFFFRCRLKCIPEKITEDKATEIYTKFIDFNTKNEQDAYLQSLIECKPIQRERRKPENDETKKSKPKSHSFKYSVSTASGKVEVCKLAFLSVHGISSERVKRLCTLLSQGKSPKDLRGKNLPGNAKPGHFIKAIDDHIASFPQKEAHYTCRSYKYLNSNLNVKIMWSLFKEKHPDLSVDYKFYLNIFQEHFDLTFGRPQIDSCCKCEELSVKLKSPSLNEAAKRVYAAELLVHKRKAKKFFKTIERIREKCLADSKVAGICMDFMQNLQLPEIPIQEVFYMRQLTVHVFNIHDIKSNKAKFYIYHEGLAKKGPNEVCSFLVDFIDSVLDVNIRHLHVFSDGAAGQNKNNVVVRLFLALIEIGRFDSIHHYFPIRGHSYLPCDRDFSVIKRKIKKTDRIFTMKQYAELMLHSTVVLDKFQVEVVESEKVKDFKSWWPQFYKKNVVSTETQARNIPRENKQKFNISSFMELTYSNKHVGEVKAKNFIDGLSEQSFDLKKMHTGSPELPKICAYTQHCVPINVKKVSDLKKLKDYIPADIVDEFYSKIYDWPTVDTDGNEEV